MNIYTSFYRLIISCLFLFSIAGQVYGQEVNPNNLSTVKVDELSDEQIRSFIAQAESSGMNESQLLQMAQQRGMPQSEIQKLRQRIMQVQSQGGSSGNNSRRGFSPSGRTVDSTADDSVGMEKSPQQLYEDSLRSRIYGANLFMNGTPKFEPNLNIATPMDYVIGARDELNIDIYGNSEASYLLTVTPDGNINVPYVGIVNVGGATIEQATARIRQKMSGVYTAMRSGGTKVNISLSNIRSIKVVVTGEVTQPGTYTLPSVASVFNALYSAGGPNSNGTLRDIRIVRDGKVVAHLDLYDFLQNGYTSANIVLKDQDVIQVDPYINRVELVGEVKRAMLFETKEGESFSDLLRYAGGFTEYAYDGRISVIRNTGKEHRIEDLLKSQFTQFEPQSGDVYTIQRILERFANRVTINGAVFRPGQYELSQGLTLSMLIKKADGLKEDAFQSKGYITRLKDDFQLEQLSFSVADVLAGTQEDIVLKREDLIVIPSLFDLREEYKVSIDGEVRKKGTFNYAEGMTLEELIMMAGGFNEAASAHRIEVARRVRNADIMNEAATTARVFLVDIDRSLKDATKGFKLQPFDMVVVRSEAGYQSQKTVRIEGEVLYPGTYSISRKDERISDIVKRAGGFTPYAFVDGASLRREPVVNVDTTMTSSREDTVLAELTRQQERQRLARVRALQGSVEYATTDEEDLQYSINNYNVGINLSKIMSSPKGEGDLLVEQGDLITVPKQLQTVKISGEVLAPSTAVYNPNRSFRQYISQAGGFSPRALKKRAYVVYANGSAQGTGKFLFFNNYPKVKPGSEIFVPQRPPRERVSTAAWIGIASSIVTTAVLIINVLR
ncbi:SLBB domain-containing protein [Olivibacter sitiensis]|uniref:SLBB domain-containing protein n=1 Tax=Olivibacter sitiensis TaxID=376470 RepID=UPI0004840153|nr:SLBB domain-containing protein [Olivibacter sitiensis]